MAVRTSVVIFCEEKGMELWPFLAALLLGLLAMETSLGHRFASALEPSRPSEVRA